jgi:hypothetical protein
LILTIFLDTNHQLPFLATTPLSQKGNYSVFRFLWSDFNHFR